MSAVPLGLDIDIWDILLSSYISDIMHRAVEIISKLDLSSARFSKYIHSQVSYSLSHESPTQI